MRLLFITGLYPIEAESFLRINSKNNLLQNAANAFQWAVVDGLFRNSASFDVVSFPFLASYPLGYKNLFTPSNKIYYKGVSIGKMISYCNLLLIKQLSIRRKLKHFIKQWLIENNGEELKILIYSPEAYFVSPTLKFKDKYNYEVASIITDFVSDAKKLNNNKSLFKRIQLIIEERQEKINYKYIDKFIILSKYMSEKIPEAVNNSIVIEGISSKRLDLMPHIKINSTRTLTYTGSLNSFCGIKDLIVAFMRTSNPNYRLVICGQGECEGYVAENVKIDARIVFLGNISREESIKLQTDSTVLINPRKPNGMVTKYSFPSKTIEYLSSGTPMIGYKLEGIPEEYFDHFFTVEDLSIDVLSKTIDKVLSLSDELLYKKALSAWTFIKENKTSLFQVKKMLNYLSL